jgi:hypothetical protein
MYIHTPSFTPGSTVLLEKLTGSQLVKKFPTFYGTRRFLKIYLNIIPKIYGYACVYQVVSFPQFPHQNPVYISPIRTTYPANLILDFTTRTIFGDQYRSLSSSPCIFLHSPIISSLLGPNILLNALLSNILSLRSSLNVSDQVPHPYTTTGKIIVLTSNELATINISFIT